MNLEVVAKRAKVSTATVSRVLNNVGPVKNSTRTRVLKAVEELKYHPNLHARSLAGGQNRTIGMIVSNMENPFFFDIYKAAERDARHNGFEMVIANTDYRADHLVNSIRLMIGRRVAGLAVIVSEMDSDLIAELTDSKIPIVFYDVGTPRQNISNIKVDYARGIEKAGDSIGRSGEAAADLQAQGRDSMDGDSRLRGNRPRQGGAFEADEVHVNPVGSERQRVVPHTGAASEISEGDDGGSH